MEKVLETNGIVGLANGTVLMARDGRESIIADSGSPIVDDSGKTVGVVLVFRDITEKIGLEAELRQAHKMEAIGTLAGGIAHEFNNVLGIIIGNAELAMDDIEKWHPVADNLREIKIASLRAKDVVKQLLTFSRKVNVRREPTDIRMVVQKALKLLRAVIPSSVQMREILPEKIDTIAADANQIHQLMINLCNNAVQAMREMGGILTIELRNIVLEAEAAPKSPDLKPGAYVRLSISDTGHGIPADMLDKIFDPYFTTKEVGEGPGMGLAVVHGIVKAHNGVIDIQSRVGRGTTLQAYFPAIQKNDNQDGTGKKPLPTGNERILLVDDEPSIVKLCHKSLSQLGYAVTSDTDPVKIREWFRLAPHDYDLVISDMTMPNLMGDWLAVELIEIRPDIPIIICTGFSESMSPERARQLGLKGLLMKPIEKAELAETVRKVLDGDKFSD